MDRKEHSKKLRNKIITTLVTLLLIASVALCLSVVIQVAKNGHASFGGYSFFRVVTGSMEPTVPIGSIILTDECDIEDIYVDDIVCFNSKSSELQGQTVTHRVIEKRTVDGEILLTTRGDANTSADGYYVTREDLVGKVIWYSGEGDFLSDILAFLTSKTGFVVCIALPCLLIVGMIFRDCVGNIKGDIKKIMEEAEKEGSEQICAEAKEGDAEKSDDLPEPAQNNEDYEEMCARIRAELIEELKQKDDREKPKTE